MIVQHWTEAEDFQIEAVDTASQGAGLFVYPGSDGGYHAIGWPNRTQVLLDVPDDALVEVQRFAPGEAGNEDEVIELFIPAARSARSGSRMRRSARTMKRKRPPVQIVIRVDPDAKEQWESAARADDRTLAAWIRTRLSDAAAKELPKGS